MSNSTPPAFQRQQFRKSSRSGQDPHRCVEVAHARGWVAIRDSKRPWDSRDDHHLVFTAAQFAAFLDGVRHGELA
ncbi:DUF397 domain-containing protein [Pseudonocardia acaciae]|uniref:DUF397 domain-containing protein n=1 Tax=Pseudonocardia acaciae TaxID=551276 RepID=UPI00048CD8D3|nr:DUF397 domain-containing protein [Pseudonocardia acaciae]